MTRRTIQNYCAALLTLALLLSRATAAPLTGADADRAPESAARGQALYDVHCANCHSAGRGEAPNIEALRRMPPASILQSMESGLMQLQGSALSARERRELAQFLGRRSGKSHAFRCDAPPAARDGNRPRATRWANWGHDAGNRRWVMAAQTTLRASSIERLSLDWVFAIPGGTRARSQPALDAHSLYLGTQSGVVYSLDRHSGCERWRFAADGEVRVAPALTHIDGVPAVVVADMAASVYALAASDGSLLWRSDLRDHPDATITGSPVVHADRVFVPVSSREVVSAIDPQYACCSFRGSVVALSAGSGKQQWRQYTIDSIPEIVGRNRDDSADRLAPSGAPVWSTITVDADRGWLYVGTGQNYSAPGSPGSDSVLALDIGTGRIAWAFQAQENDSWNAACLVGVGSNCPHPEGPDFDFGAAPILTATADERPIVLAGQKSGAVFALDPRAGGGLVWRRDLGHGGFNGGVHWGMAATGKLLIVPISDSPANADSDKSPLRPGITALRLGDGSVLWQQRFRIRDCKTHDYRCYPSLSAAPTIAADLVFAGGLDGVLRAWDLDTGEQLWRFDTVRKYAAVNGGDAVGGSIDSDGPVIDADQLFITSGYDKFGEIPGNVLLAFRLAEPGAASASNSGEPTQ